MAMKLSQVVIVMGLIGLAGCSSGARDMRLHYLKTNSGTPEEFAIVPNKPLETPPAMTALPAPTPGSANRTDQTPKASAVAALGGNPARVSERGTPSGNGALLQRAGRYGTDPNIRTDLAAADFEHRKRASRFSYKIVPQDEYYDAYREQWLNSHDALDAYRRAGIKTPSAPPAGWDN
ncbi:DUF3035 domain-containing protein [Salipiger bermudensis]|uniref:DUF3035 domain-containing protein n=1 Tax=Salipiger bermudensis TaxID=344736 RepID=UPI001CD1F810|nr:DUF3035 domain-containing protein [Salipiger bermudensis]MCA0961388.1 DUF3035 domain-containing protein [Salipiger bermudensis]